MPAMQFSDVTSTSEGSMRRIAGRYTGTATSMLAAVIGMLVIVGWARDIEMLKRLRPGLTAMNPLTATCFIFSGVGVLLAQSGWRRSAQAAGSFMLFVTLAKAVDLAWGGVPVDKLMFASRLALGGGIPNAMAPNTALAFGFVGLALVLAATQRRKFCLISQWLAALVLAVSMFALIGYGFGVSSLNAVGPFIPMAVHTAFSLGLVSLGLFSLTPQYGLMLVLRDSGAAGLMGRTTLPLAVLAPVAVGSLRLWGQTKGYYGTEAGVALMVIANVLITSVLLITSIVTLHRSDQSRRCRELDLSRSEAHYRLAEQVAQVGHWRMDLPSLRVSWSDEIFSISGISKTSGAPSATNVLKTYHPDDRNGVRQSIREALREGRDWQYTVRICRPDGEIRHVSSHGVCEFGENGKLTGLFGVFADVTDLEAARRTAEDATSAKAAFLANMSHEIRTPLNGVMGFAELLLESKLEAEQKRHATLIFDSAQTLLKLLNDILDVSKIEAGQLQVAQEPFDLAHQLRQCVRLMDGIAQNKGLELALTVDPALPQYVVGDGLRVRQILLNLLGNAIKFTAAGSITVEAAPTRAKTGDPMLEIRVTDTGVGIPQARQAAIFEEFVQADASTARQYGGSGLGLSISRSLAMLMGGEIKLESQEGNGTQVTFTTPLTAVTHPLRRDTDPAAELRPTSRQGRVHNSGSVILLAEDLDINQELITGMLERMGHKVEIADNGEEAIRLASRLQNEPAAYGMIFMDVQMPVIDGIEATRAIRALGGRAATIPIVALTANAYASDVERCRSAGMVDHVSKPVSMAALGAAVTKWLGEDGPLVERRNANDAVQVPLAAKFAQRKIEYTERLVELRDLLTAANVEDQKRLFSEVESMAHKLAGTAAMFDEQWLGEQASVIENIIRNNDDNDTACVDKLIDALRLAA